MKFSPEALQKGLDKRNVLSTSLAEKLNITESCLHSKMKGHKAFTIEEAFSIADILEIQPTEFTATFFETSERANVGTLFPIH
ncbi:MAG: DUF739 domain-containing protein [Eubacteriales bacterium]